MLSERGHFTKCADVTPVSNLYFPRRLQCDCDCDVNAGSSIVPRGSICRNRRTDICAARDEVFRDEVVKGTLISILVRMLHTRNQSKSLAFG